MKSSPFILFAAGTLLICGCNSHRDVSQRTSALEVVPVRDFWNSSKDNSAENRAEAFARFAAGLSYEFNDKSDQALEQFYRAAQADPRNEPLVLELSQRLTRKQQFDKAIEILSRSAREPSVSGDVSSALSGVYLAAGKTNLAIQSAQTAIKKSPDLISGYQILSGIYLQNGQTNATLKVLDSASRRTSSNAAFLIKLASLYGLMLEPAPKQSSEIRQRGLAVLNRAAALKPANPNSRRTLADHFAQFGDLKKATELYLDLLNEFSDMPLMRDALRERLTNLYLQGSDKSKAAEQLESIVRDNPTRYPEAWLYLGNFAYDAKNYVKAEEYLKRALLLNPDLEQAYYDLSGAQMNSGQSLEALQTLEIARKKFPTSFMAELFSGMSFVHLKNYSEALKHFTAAEVIGNATDSTRLTAFFYFQLGSVHERLGNFSDSEQYLEKCLKLAPDFAEALNYLGFMWADRGVNLDKAREMLERAVKIEPKNAAFLDSLGWVLFKLKQNDAALKYILQAVELSDEPDPALYDHLGDIYSALKQNEKARSAWGKSISLEPNDTVKKKLEKSR